MSDNGDFGAFAAGFLVGGIVSAVAALILAPQSGEETRKQIVDTSIELRDKADDGIRKIRETTDQGIAKIKEASEEYAKKASSAYGDVKGKVTTAIEEGIKVKLNPEAKKDAPDA